MYHVFSLIEGLYEWCVSDVFVASKGDRANLPNVAILITDGKSSYKDEPDKYEDPEIAASVGSQLCPDNKYTITKI